MTFPIGTVVYLKSGGPPMTVYGNRDDRCEVDWFNGVELKQSEFHPAQLTTSTLSRLQLTRSQVKVARETILKLVGSQGPVTTLQARDAVAEAIGTSKSHTRTYTYVYSLLQSWHAKRYLSYSGAGYRLTALGVKDLITT